MKSIRHNGRIVTIENEGMVLKCGSLTLTKDRGSWDLRNTSMPGNSIYDGDAFMLYPAQFSGVVALLRAAKAIDA